MSTPTIRVKLDVQADTDPDNTGTEVTQDLDVHVNLEGEGEDIPARFLSVRFTSEGIIIDVFENGEFVGTSAEGYDDLIDRLAGR